MALRNRSLILYGLEVDANNQSIDFKNDSMGAEINATLNLGFYSLTSLLAEVKRAMEEADPDNTYTVTADRTVSGGTENRITISTSGGFLSLLFATGSRAASSAGSLLGFTGDQTGSTTYTGTSTCGTTLIPEMVGYNYQPPETNKKIQGNVSVSASGKKEAIVYQIMRYIDIQFKYELEDNLDAWEAWWDWAIQMRVFDFTPDYVLSPETVYNVTLDKTVQDGKGLGFKMKEMLPKFPFLYDTGLMTFKLEED